MDRGFRRRQAARTSTASVHVRDGFGWNPRRTLPRFEGLVGRPMVASDRSGHDWRRLSRRRTGPGSWSHGPRLLRQGAYTIGFDVKIALLWGRSMSTGTREIMPNPSVNNYVAGDGKEFWIVGLEGDRHWPALTGCGSIRVVGRRTVRHWARPSNECPRADSGAGCPLRHAYSGRMVRSVRCRAGCVLGAGQLGGRSLGGPAVLLLGRPGQVPDEQGA